MLVKTVSAAQPGQFAEVVQGVVHVGNFDAGHAARAVAFAEQEQFLEVLILLKSAAGAGSNRPIVESMGLHVMLDQPQRPLRAKLFKRLEGGSHVIAGIDRLAHIVQECREQEFLIIRQFVLRRSNTCRL